MWETNVELVLELRDMLNWEGDCVSAIEVYKNEEIKRLIIKSTRMMMNKRRLN